MAVSPSTSMKALVIMCWVVANWAWYSSKRLANVMRSENEPNGPYPLCPA